MPNQFSVVLGGAHETQDALHGEGLRQHLGTAAAARRSKEAHVVEVISRC